MASAMSLRGTVTTAGSRLLEGFVAPYTATAVERLLDEDVSLDVRDPRARRIKLSVDERGVRLTLPPRASLVMGERFLEQHRDWLALQLRQYQGQGLPVLMSTDATSGNRESSLVSAGAPILSTSAGEPTMCSRISPAFFAMNLLSRMKPTRIPTSIPSSTASATRSLKRTSKTIPG